jgi:peptidoglycan/xylan/chitin deacetylase (PgdA/CDA1 family)
MRPPLVLAYHGLGRYPRQLDPSNLMVDPDRFTAQIRSLRRRGYRFMPLSAFVQHLDRGEPPAGVCAVTFDDGTVDNLAVVEPLLAELDLPATVFACPGLLGTAHFSMEPEAKVRLMDGEQLCTLARSRFVEIGSHTNTHADLSQATAEEAYREMASSKLALEDLLGRPITAFAYPKCGYSTPCPDAARRAGYDVAVTCAGHGGWRRFELARESIDSLDRRISFALKSRRLFMPLRNSRAGVLMRSAARPLRHRASK